MAKKFLTGLNLVVLDTDPATGSEGELYFNSSASVAKIYQAGAWSVLGAGDVDSKSTSSVYLVRNNTGLTILKGTLVSASGAEPSGRIDVEPFAAVGGINSELTVMGMATANISNGVNGEVISFGTLTGLDTRGNVASSIAVGDETWAEGDILFAHPTVAGKLTKVRPQHDLAVAFITVRHASTGQIAVRIIPGNNHLEWMHDVLISGSVQNNELLAYNSASGLWINQTAEEAGLLTEESASSTYLTQLSASMNYLTSDDAIMLYQPISVRLFNLTGLENVEGFLRTDGGLGWGVDTATYLTTESASSTYLTQTDASSVYLTQTNAANTYLTPATSASIYQPLDGNLTAIVELSSGSPGFLKKNIFNEWVIDSNTYLTTFDAGETYQPIGNYATIDGIETLTNKTISSPIIHGNLTFNGDLEYHTFSASANSLFIDVFDDLYIHTNNGSIILQPDEFVKIYDELVATQEWVEFQDYLTVSSASALYSQIDHNHTIDSLSNVEISSLSDGDSIVWNSASSKWINQIIEGGGGSSVTISSSAPTSPSEGDLWFDSDTLELFIFDSLYWIEVSGGGAVDLSSYLTIASASSTYLTQSSASLTYLSLESDTLETVTGRGATSSNAITISNTTEATDSTTGALIVSGGVGVAKDLWVDGNLHVAGTTTTENTKTVATHDNLIYLNAALDSTITNAVFASGSITYTAENLYTAGMDIRITGVDPAGFNISTGDNLTVASATSTQFIVIKSNPGASYVSGGTAHAKEEANPDLGFAGGYYDAGYAHAGLFRDSSDGIFKFFKGYTPEPDEAVNIDTGHASFELADIMALNATLSGSVSVGAIFAGAWVADVIDEAYIDTDIARLSSPTFSGTVNIPTLNLTNALSYSYGGTGLTSLGTSGQVLKVNSGATALEWGTVDALPSQSGNNGKYLTTDGSTASWGTLDLSLYLTLSSASTTYATILSPTLTTPNIGAATGTSLTTTGNVISHVDISTPTFVTNSYTITSTDDGKLLMLNNSTTAGNLLIPTDATFNFPIGTQINIVQAGTGLITVAAVTPATTTVNATPGKKLRAQWSSAAIVKTAANTWLLMGDLTV
jgi:hypothetical protein